MLNPRNVSARYVPPILLAVRDVHDEVRAGLGQTALVVRTLDGVSLDVRAGELVVLQGGVASGAVSLLETLAGRRRRLSGTRVVAHGVQVRMGTISPAAFQAIAMAWSPALYANEARDSPHRSIVYLFRVRNRQAAEYAARTTPSLAAFDEVPWQRWAEALRERGGSVLAHVPSLTSVNDPRRNKHGVGAVREMAPAAADSVPTSPTLRVLTLRAGRIITDDGRSLYRHDDSLSAPPRDRRTTYIQGSSTFADSRRGS